MSLKGSWSAFRKFVGQHKKFIIVSYVAIAIWFFGLGILGSWLLTKGGLESFPEIKSSERLLVIAPHIDDEVISSAGVIQEALQNGAKIKVVYMTNGDNSLGSVVRKDKSLNLNPNEFIALGEKRMNEGKAATQTLGLSEDNLIFLGYPDRGLASMLDKNFDSKSPYSSQGTKFSFNPYSGTYKTKQVYAGANLLADLQEIIKNFKPTLVIVSHPRDHNLDHRATFIFTERALKAEKSSARVFAYLIHYSLYPPEKHLATNEFLYPPKKLFTKNGWFSFELTPEAEDKKLMAVEKNASQKEFGRLYDLILSFVKKNEIFEEFD